MVRLQGGIGRGFGVITTLKNNEPRGGEDRRLIEIQVIGEILDGVADALALPARRFPPPAARARAASRGAVRESSPGRSRDDRSARWQRGPTCGLAITDDLLGKHFAVLGTTGSGKSCSVTLILADPRGLPNGHVICSIRTTNTPAFGERAEVLDPANLKLPYWLLNFEEIAAILVARTRRRARIRRRDPQRAILRAKRSFCGEHGATEHITVDTPVPYRLSELISLKNEIGALDKPDATVPYRAPGHAHREPAGRRALRLHVLGVRPTTCSRSSRGCCAFRSRQPLTIIDLSGVPSEIVDVLVSVMCRMIFDFALWSAEHQAAADPVRLRGGAPLRAARRRLGFEPTRRAIARIAKEGRKYGVSLVPGEPAPVGAVADHAVAVQHDLRAAHGERARPQISCARACRTARAG